MSVLPLLKRLRRQCTGVLGTALAMTALPGVSEVATFTDSRGRTTLFEYSLKDEWDAMAPRGVLVYTPPAARRTCWGGSSRTPGPSRTHTT